MMNPFDWLRHRTCAAVVDGFADAVERIDRGDVARLQERLTLALAAPAPAASPEAPGDVSPAAGSDATTDAPAPAANVARGGKRVAK